MELEIQFIASASLLTLMKAMSFELRSVNSVGSGLNDFLFYEQLEQEAYKASTTWEALMNGTTGATTADLAPLLKVKIKLPQAYAQADSVKSGLMLKACGTTTCATTNTHRRNFQRTTRGQFG